MQDGLRRLHFSSPDTAPKASLCLYLTLTYWIAAWWIAFGPHGPRAEAPPGEWTRVSLYSGIGLVISAVLFLVIHSFSRPPPRTMTKEWQEATNEYLKVRIPLRFSELGNQPLWHTIDSLALMLIFSINRKKSRTLFTASLVRDTRARVMYKASRPRLWVSS
jgi:hypothetical protein